MSLHDRVLDILEGRIRMGAAKPRKPRKPRAGIRAGIRAGSNAPKKALPKKPLPKKPLPKKPRPPGAPRKKLPRQPRSDKKVKSAKRVASSKKAVAKNPWIAYVKAYADQFDLSYGEAIKAAACSYQELTPAQKKSFLK